MSVNPLLVSVFDDLIINPKEKFWEPLSVEEVSLILMNYLGNLT